MIIIDGLGDEPIKELGGRTPLEAAYIPNIQNIARCGRIGRIRTAFQGFPIESMVCIMGLLGYDPKQYYPCGRASFEAMARGIPLASADLVLRCNTVTVDMNRQVLTDFTAGMINDADARSLLSQIKLPYENWELYPGQSYRNILIVRNAEVDIGAFKCREPHMKIGEPIRENLPQSEDAKTAKLAEKIAKFLLETQDQITKLHLPNSCVANMLWVWSPSRKPVWPSFYVRTGVRAAVVGGMDFINGIAKAAQMHFEEITGATGYIDTDYRAKAEFTRRYLQEYDFVLTHINATDEEAHQRNFRGKIEAIEKIDRYIVGPILCDLRKKYNKSFQIIVCGDHTTRCSDGKHADDPVPYAHYGSHIPAGDYVKDLSEKEAQYQEPLCSLAFFQKIIRGAK